VSRLPDIVQEDTSGNVMLQAGLDEAVSQPQSENHWRIRFRSRLLLDGKPRAMLGRREPSYKRLMSDRCRKPFNARLWSEWPMERPRRSGSTRMIPMTPVPMDGKK